jgi:hypothetical protein
MGDQRERGDDRMNDDQDQAATAADAADLLGRLRAQLDPPEQHDIRDKQADWRLRRAAELARERAERDRAE